MRIHGKYGVVYMAAASGTAASPVAFQSDWTISWTIAFHEVTAFGDPQKIWVAAPQDIGGEFSGFYDDSSRQYYTAARDGVPRNFYLYPDFLDDPNQYYFGTMLPDQAVSGGLSKAVDVKSTWKPAGPIWLAVFDSTYQMTYQQVYPGTGNSIY